MITGSSMIAATMLIASAALAQTGGTPVETAPVPLPPDKGRWSGSMHSGRRCPRCRPGAPIAVGAIVPDKVELWSLPQDMVTEVPSVTRYKFFRAGNTIAVVDPDNRKIIQVIKN